MAEESGCRNTVTVRLSSKEADYYNKVRKELNLKALEFFKLAIVLLLKIARVIKEGGKLYVADKSGTMTLLEILELEGLKIEKDKNE